jgi:hypothetical protein
MKYARALDAGLIFDNETDSSELRDENIFEIFKCSHFRK